jgi:hypothetical protein
MPNRRVMLAQESYRLAESLASLLKTTRASSLEEVDFVTGGYFLKSVPILAWIAAAAAFLSGAFRIGRPTTI